MSWEERARKYRNSHQPNPSKFKQLVHEHKLAQEKKREEAAKMADQFLKRAQSIYNPPIFESTNRRPPKGLPTMPDFRERLFTRGPSRTRPRVKSLTDDISCFYDKPLLLLKKLNIHSLGDWRRWMMSHHPDKTEAYNDELVKAVNSAVTILFK